MDKLIAGARIKGVSYPLDFHTHQQHEILLLHGGNCRFLVGNQLYHLQPGNLLMLDGRTVHRAYVVGNEQTYERSILRFDEEWIRPLLEELKVAALLQLFTENQGGGVVRTFNKRVEMIIENRMKELAQLFLMERNGINDARQKLAVAQLLIQISLSTEQVIRKEKTIGEEKTKIAEKISNYIFHHYAQSFSIDDIAAEVDLSKSYLSHTFKEVTGQTIMTYLMNFRLSKARDQLVQEPQKTIKAISQENGFESEAHFNRFFKRNIGATPGRYRKEQGDRMEADKGM